MEIKNRHRLDKNVSLFDFIFLECDSYVQKMAMQPHKM